MGYNLIAEGYGKIEKANLRVKPLTLLIGDNNSGKSYLLSLIWGLKNLDYHPSLFDGMFELDNPGCKALLGELKQSVEAIRQGKEQKVAFYTNDFAILLNALFERNKEKFISSIFNYHRIQIDKLSIQLDYNLKIELSSVKASTKEAIWWVRLPDKNIGQGRVVSEEGTSDYIVRLLVEIIVDLILNGSAIQDSSVYLPAARTGFVLAKDAINKTGRQKAYDWFSGEDVVERTAMQPFTKPIIHFLNMLEDLSVDAVSDNADLVDWMEINMAHGKVEYQDAGSREIRYIPKGTDNSIPLRTSSAIITELAPLMLILKYKKFLKTICYEEPEMCLHPQLQLEMGRLLVRMANRGITVVATTHSDIILQHVNNMMKANAKKATPGFLQELDIMEEECLDVERVAVYQLTDCGATSIVEELLPGNDGFHIPTFSNALMRILEKTTTILDYEGELEE